ncbi:regulator of chromosome condensation 1/beta-lactamase-inhibitor protein II [Powellomyces hirtus]|nr:regulator of chromosome condensation 1/beta-lactamase-inhibitor protein II [Powellomyces hirtus]
MLRHASKASWRAGSLRFKVPQCVYSTTAVPHSGSVERQVWSWGSGGDGKLGHGEQTSRTTPHAIQPLTGCRIENVVCGASHTAALLNGAAGGHVFSWGSNFYGQAGHIPESSGFLDEDDDDQYSVPTGVKGTLQNKDIAAIACGDFHTLALSREGDVYSWGAGILGHGTEYHDSNPLPITFFTDIARRVRHIAASHNTSCALAEPRKQGSGQIELYAWGHLSSTGRANSPVLVARALASPMLDSLDNVDMVACGDSVVAVAGVVGDERRVMVFGQPPLQQSGVPEYPEPRDPATKVVDVWDAPPCVDIKVPNSRVNKLLCGHDFGLAVHANGSATMFPIPSSTALPTSPADRMHLPTNIQDALLTPTSLLLLLTDGQITGWTITAKSDSRQNDAGDRPWWRFWRSSDMTTTTTATSAATGPNQQHHEQHATLLAAVTRSPPTLVGRCEGATQLAGAWEHFVAW